MPPAARPAAPTAAGGAPAGASVLAVPVVPHSAAAVRMAAGPDSGAWCACGRARRGERKKERKGRDAAREGAETRGRDAAREGAETRGRDAAREGAETREE